MIRCCKGCVPPKRSIRCHSTCPEYLEEKERHDQFNKLKDEKKKKEDGLIEYEIKSKNRTIKRMGRTVKYR